MYSSLYDITLKPINYYIAQLDIVYILYNVNIELCMGGLEFTLNWRTNLLVIIVISDPNTSVNTH